MPRFFNSPELLPAVTSLGCYVEKKWSKRFLNIKFGSFTSSHDPNKPYASVVKCAHLARDKGYKYFAVQNYAVCRTDDNIANGNYATYGEASPDKCVGGVGASLTNFVYQLGPAEADGPLEPGESEYQGNLLMINLIQTCRVKTPYREPQ